MRYCRHHAGEAGVGQGMGAARRDPLPLPPLPEGEGELPARLPFSPRGREAGIGGKRGDQGMIGTSYLRSMPPYGILLVGDGIYRSHLYIIQTITSKACIFI